MENGRGLWAPGGRRRGKAGPSTPARNGKPPPRPSEPRPDDAAHKKAATHASAERMAWESHADALIAAFICGVWRAKKGEGRLGRGFPLRAARRKPRT